jgi:hypothetical protein
MSSYEQIATAEAVIAAAERGDYDAQLGVSPEHRALLTRATGTDPMSLQDVRALHLAGRVDLIAAAYDAGRITTTTTEEN